jgi:hypothetical protein
MYDLKNTTKLSDALYTLLCVVRLFAFLPLILTSLCFVPIMYLLAVTAPLDKLVRLFEGVVFDVKD